jgi:hypothetical protein
VLVCNFSNSNFLKKQIYIYFCGIEREINDPTDYEREERIWNHIKDFFGGIFG